MSQIVYWVYLIYLTLSDDYDTSDRALGPFAQPDSRFPLPGKTGTGSHLTPSESLPLPETVDPDALINQQFTVDRHGSLFDEWLRNSKNVSCVDCLGGALLLY
jgi:hypothetical protein